MKALFFFLFVFVLLIPSCKKQESNSSAINNKVVTFSEIKGTTVYDQSNRETSITGNVVARDLNIPTPFMELGIVMNGKLDLTFPDVFPEQANRFFENVNLRVPELEISPQDATWLLFDDSKFFLVFTNEDVPDIFDPKVTTKQNYILRLYDLSGEFEIWLAFFTVDTTVKGNGNFFGYTYDVNINASKGWNVINVKNSPSSTEIKTSVLKTTDIKWVAEKTNTSYGYFYRIP